MGIRGLLTMIKNASAFEVIDLVEEAKKKGGIEVLVDFHALIRFLIETFTKKIASDYDNEYLYLPIGVYDLFSDAIYDFHKGFGDAGIRLVWIVDGPKGVDELASEQKEETWVSRDKEDAIKMDGVLSACRHRLPLHDIQNLGPIIHFETALSALKKAGAEVINLLQGEADDFIAFEFHRRKSFAILTNDTDFVIFKDCVVLFEQLLSFNCGDDNLKLSFVDNDDPGKIFKKPDTLKCPLIKQSHILNIFDFTNFSQLIALSILKGNDNTSEFASELQYHLKITKSANKTPHVTHVAKFIVKRSITSENLAQMPEMKTFMVNCPQLLEAIQFTKDLYSLKRINENMRKGLVLYDPSTKDDSLTGFLAKKLSEGEISKKVYSAHFGVIHDSVCPEKVTKECPGILTLMCEIRKLIYPYILDEKLKDVIEWRSRCEEVKVTVPVKHADFKTHMIKGRPDGDSSSSDIYGIDLFEEVISHQEKNGSLNYVKKYGIEKGFICYLLRYLYLLTNGKYLKVKDKEFRALFVTVFYQYARSKDVKFQTKLNNDVFLGMKICPTERCIILATWFMNIYFTAKYLCGGAFNLTDEFPTSSQIMNGATLYAFYENLMSDVNERTNHLEETILESIGSLEKEITTMYGEEYDTVFQ